MPQPQALSRQPGAHGLGRRRLVTQDDRANHHSRPSLCTPGGHTTYFDTHFDTHYAAASSSIVSRHDPAGRERHPQKTGRPLQQLGRRRFVRALVPTSVRGHCFAPLAGRPHVIHSLICRSQCQNPHGPQRADPRPACTSPDTRRRRRGGERAAPTAPHAHATPRGGHGSAASSGLG